MKHKKNTQMINHIK